jgi:hypothetical protein
LRSLRFELYRTKRLGAKGLESPPKKNLRCV